MIWGCRNDVWLNQPQLEASMTRPKAVTYVEEYLEANKRVDSTKPITENKWLPPPNDCVKLNVAWQRFKESKTYGVGSVIRDYAGVLLAAHCEILPQVGDNLTMATRGGFGIGEIWPKSDEISPDLEPLHGGERFGGADRTVTSPDLEPLHGGERFGGADWTVWWCRSDSVAVEIDVICGDGDRRCGGGDRTTPTTAGGGDSRFLFVKPKRKWEREREMEVGRSEGGGKK
uniref:Uncharacterized protein n=1 Tax=Fagus sylvatica TaxID=28930 RepID=A0A2N9F998_FAGSY